MSADLDALAREFADDLMLDAARSVTRLQATNMIGGHSDLVGVSDAEYDRFIDGVLDLIETADITIDMPGG